MSQSDCPGNFRLGHSNISLDKSGLFILDIMSNFSCAIFIKHCYAGFPFGKSVPHCLSLVRQLLKLLSNIHFSIFMVFIL